MPNRIHLLWLIALADAAPGRAEDVFKCTGTDGAVAFQATHCAADRVEAIVHIADPPKVQPAQQAPTEGEQADAGVSQQAPSKVIVQGGSLPQLWNCTRAEDGAPFISRDGPTPPRMVPLGILGGPSRSLASAYAPGGIGVSAPGMRKTPIDTSPQDAIASQYVAVQDHCEPATKEQVCIYLQQQLNDVQKKLQRAFKDEQATLKPQETELLRQMQGC